MQTGGGLLGTLSGDTENQGASLPQNKVCLSPPQGVTLLVFLGVVHGLLFGHNTPTFSFHLHKHISAQNPS